MPLPLYYDSLDTARRQDDVMLWRNSLKENIRCKNAIEKALAENFDGMHLKDGIIPPLAEEYGTDRLTWVLANTVKEHMDDGRFRPANKEWADGIYIPKDRRNYEFSVGSHPEIVNGLITDYRRYLSDVLHQYGVGDCLPGSNHDNYEHQLLILNPFRECSIIRAKYRLRGRISVPAQPQKERSAYDDFTSGNTGDAD